MELIPFLICEAIETRLNWTFKFTKNSWVVCFRRVLVCWGVDNREGFARPFPVPMGCKGVEAEFS